MKRTKERADDRQLRVRAIHEAGHAVFMWRTGEVLYGDNWSDRIAPFEAIILSPYVGDDVPPLVFRADSAGTSAPVSLLARSAACTTSTFGWWAAQRGSAAPSTSISS